MPSLTNLRSPNAQPAKSKKGDEVGTWTIFLENLTIIQRVRK